MCAKLEERPRIAGKDEESRDIYVHLMSGEVVTLSGITQLELTDYDIELRRLGLPPVRFPRSEVFFTTANPDDAPPQC